MNEEKLIEEFGVQRVINGLTPFLTEQRCARIDNLLKSRIESVHVAAESTADMHNALAMVRTAEALGAFHFHLIGQERKKRMGRQTMRGTDRWMHLHLHEKLGSFIENMKSVVLIGASPRAEMTLEEIPIDQPLCLLFGNERRGLSEEAIQRCDLTYRIPMDGMCESFNLSVSCGISLYDVLKRKRNSLGRKGDLTPQQVEVERARCYIRSLGVKQSAQLLSVL